jgi:hypothetical protein
MDAHLRGGVHRDGEPILDQREQAAVLDYHRVCPQGIQHPHEGQCVCHLRFFDERVHGHIDAHVMGMRELDRACQLPVAEVTGEMSGTEALSP